MDADLVDENAELVSEFCRETEEALDALDAHIRNMKHFVYDLDFQIEEYTNFCRGLQVELYLENLRAVNRVVHTIKGISSFLEFQKVNAYCHGVEELTLNLAKGQIYLSQGAYEIIERLPVLLNRFLETIKEDFNDKKVDVDSEMQDLEICTQNLLNRMEGKVIHLESLRGKDVGRVRDYRKELKVSINLNTYDNIIHEFQAFAQNTVTSMGFHKVNFDLVQSIKRSLMEHLEQLIVASQVKIVLSRYPRLVSDLSRSLGKKIVFKVERNDAHARPDTWDRCHNALVHLVRNSVDHGIESPDEREKLGKNTIGNMRMSVFEDFRNIYVTLEDDGCGIDPEKVARIAVEREVVTALEVERMSDLEKQKLIFRAGFSTRTVASDVSGRGVGMDAVIKEIEGNLNGQVVLSSRKGVGTSFLMEIPKAETLSECIRFGTDKYMYAVPVVSNVEYMECNPLYLNSVMGKTPLYTEREMELPLLNLFAYLHPDEYGDMKMDHRPIIKIGGEGDKSAFGLVVPEIAGQERIKIDRRKALRKIVKDPGLVFGYGLTDPITVVLDLDHLKGMI